MWCRLMGTVENMYRAAQVEMTFCQTREPMSEERRNSLIFLATGVTSYAGMAWDFAALFSLLLHIQL